MVEPKTGKRLIAGTNCYFDYDMWEEEKRKQQEELHSKPSITPMNDVLDAKAPSKKKKKKKKSKGGETTQAAKFSVKDVSLTDPDAEYPESRVIKVGPNGDLIVESLDDEYPRVPEEKAARTMVPPVPSIPPKLALKILDFDPDQERFWNELSVEAQKQMFTIDDTAISESMYQKQKELSSRNIQADGGSGHDHLWAANSKCYCPSCERNDLHIVNLIDEGFDAYMEDLIDGLWEQFELQYYDINPGSRFIDIPTAQMILSNQYIEDEYAQRFNEIKQIEAAGKDAGEMASTVRNYELFHYIENILMPVMRRHFAIMLKTQVTHEERERQDDILNCAHQIQRLILMRTDGTMPRVFGLQSPIEYQRMSASENFLDCLYSFLKQGVSGIMKAMEFVKILASVGRPGDPDIPDVIAQMTKLADSFHRTEGKTFIEEVTRIKEQEAEHDEDNETGDPELEHYAIRNPFNHCKCDFHTELSQLFEAARAKAMKRARHLCEDMSEGEEPDYDDHYDDDHECEHGHHYHDDEYEGDEDDGDLDYSQDEAETDEEEAEERRFKELRGFFFMEARNIIVKRFNDAYKNRVSEDRTKKFIEELEAEENAKKEKELKKLKQREKQKEKKRLQQLEREELRKKKEAEEAEKAALLKKHQEELRAEQKRREDELRMKKEQEKLKKIEALRQKEQAAMAEAKEKDEKTVAESQTLMKEKVAESSPVSEKKKKQEKEKDKLKQTKASQAKTPSKTPSTVSGASTRNASKRASVLSNSLKLMERVVEPQKEKVAEKERPESEKTEKKPVESNAKSNTDDGAGDKVTEADVPINLLQSKPHLLEQLYHTRPNTVSASSGESIDLFNESASALRMGTGYSPSKNTMPSYQAEPWNPGNGSPFAGETFLSPGLDRAQYLSNTVGTANTWGMMKPQDGLGAPPIASSLGSNVPSSTIWGSHYPSRGSSIWGTAPSLINEQQTLKMWAAQKPQSDVSQVPDAQFERKEPVQSAAFKAIQETQAAPDTTNGLSSAMKIFQTAKTILNDPALKMSEFLLALHSSTRYHFDIIYDDFGSVTDIKASLQPERIFGTSSVTNKSPSPRHTHVPSLFQPQPPFPQMDHSFNFAGFGPNAMPMTQQMPMNQPGGFQPGINLDPFHSTNNTLHSSVPMSSPFAHPPMSSGQAMLGPENAGFQPGSFVPPSENAAPFDTNISETMQGSLNKLGIAQVRNNIW